MLVGESFSGPLALKLAAERPPGLKGVVLGASFARLNLPLKSVLAAASRFSARFVPMPALSWILLGRWANAKIIRLLKSVLSQVGPSVLSGRAREALTVDLLAQGIGVECPVLLLQARHDRLIPKNAVIDIGRVCPILEVKEIEGPHFLFQASYAECLSAIREFCRRLSARHGP